MSNIRDYSSIYNIKEFMIKDIAPNYFNMEDVSLMNVGLFGYITDTQATTTEDIFNTASRYIVESMPDKARLPEFIYAHAASYDITDLFSYCAKMPVFLFIKEKDIIEKGTNNGKYTEFVIDSDLVLYIEEIPFSIPYNILIRTNQYKGVYNHQCVYDMTYKNSIAQVNSPYIKTIKTVVDGDIYVLLAIDVYQYTKTKIYENILNNNKLNIPYIDVDIDGNICNFEILYKDPKIKETVQLQKFGQTTPPSKNPFVYYKLIDESTLRFSFSIDDRYFIPKYNSELYIEVFTTLGEPGNFPWYKGNDVTVSPRSDKPELDYNNETVIFGVTRGDSTGAKAQLTLEDIRRLTLERRITVNSYTTDNDLNMYFLNYSSIHDTEAMFIKQRDDFADRSFGCYSILKNKTDIFPTNTLDINLDLDDIDVSFKSLNKHIIKAGAKFKYSTTESLSTAVKIKPDDDITDLDFCYTCVPMISICTKPNNVAFYINSIDKRISMDYEYMNQESLYQFIISDCTIYRDSLKGESNYKFTLRLTPTTDIVSSDNEEELYTNMKVLLLFDTGSNHYIKLDYISTDEETNSYIFSGIIETDDLIHDNKINITNLTNNKSELIESRMISMSNPEIKIATFYDYGTDMNKSHKLYSYPTVKDYTLTNIYKPISNELYFAYSMRLMKSNVNFTRGESSSDDFGINLSRVPLFSSWFLEDKLSTKEVLYKLVSQHKFLSDIGNAHTSNYSINMKFYNTSGRSRFFVIDDDEELLIDRVNCTLHFKIKYKDGIIAEDYVKDIRIFIKRQIEEINGLSSGINEIHISNLMADIRDNFSEAIKYMQFVNINEYDSSIQSIIMKEINTEQRIQMIPEYLTIRDEDIILTTL